MRRLNEEVVETRRIFAAVHQLLRSGQAARALRALYSLPSGRLRPPFTQNTNHAWYCVGVAAFDRRNFSEAALAFKKAARSRPDDSEALWAVADCYSELGRPKLAERYYTQALRVSREKDLSLRFNLGNALYDQGKFSDAIAQYRHVVRGKDKALRRKAQKNLALAKSHATTGQGAK